MSNAAMCGSEALERDPRDLSKVILQERGNGLGRFATEARGRRILAKAPKALAAALVFALAGASTASAGPPPNPTPSDANGNTAGGSGALGANTTGENNTADGNAALGSNTAAGGNTAAGVGALITNTTGNDNTAAGARALITNTTGGDNTASGAYALEYNTTGGDNTASGAYALESNTTGNANTADGGGALIANTSGSYNVALGYLAGGGLVTGSNNIDIGSATGAVDESKTIRIGVSQTRAFIAGIRGVKSGLTVLIDGNGQLGTLNSSARFKENIRDMAEYSRGIFALRPVTYHYKEPAADGAKLLESGLIAEEVAKVYPDLVAYGSDGQLETVQYHKLTPMLLNELQRQQRTLNAQARPEGGE